jgi:alkylation response protein AidB-like acyl-CoA dehydrogenase
LAFLDQVRAFLRDHAADAPAHDLQGLYRALGARNWLALSWPVEDGGEGLSAIYEFLLWDEMAHTVQARPPLSAGIVAKTIVRYGSAEQKARWLRPIRTGELMFSLGYSEPEAGSDLAALRTRADRAGDEYIVNGVKIWSSSAHRSDYLWLLCRTQEGSTRGAGLSLLIVDLKSPGLRIRPMRTLSGHDFTELTFDDVRVPAENLIGQEHGAWAMMAALLAVERHVQFSPKRVRRDFERVRAWAEAHGLGDDPVVRDRLADCAVDVLEAQAHALSVLALTLQGGTAAVEAAANKRHYTDAIQKLARTAMDFGAPEALLEGSVTELLWRQTLEESIGGGTTEIMTGILARQGLGLKS